MKKTELIPKVTPKGLNIQSPIVIIRMDTTILPVWSSSGINNLKIAIVSPIIKNSIEPIMLKFFFNSIHLICILTSKFSLFITLLLCHKGGSLLQAKYGIIVSDR